MEAIQQQGNEAMIDSLLDDLSRTDDSTEAARKAKLLRMLVSGVPLTIEETEKAAKHIAGTAEHERLETDIAFVKRTSKLGLVWSLCSAGMIIAAFVWMGASPANHFGPNILLGIGAALNVINAASFFSGYRLVRFARDIKRINDQAYTQER